MQSVMFSGMNPLQKLGASLINGAASSINRVEEMADNNKVPLIVHAFSNGGTVVVESIEALIHENSTKLECTDYEPSTVIEETDTKQQKDTQLFADRLQLGGQVFDSAPLAMHMQAGTSTIGHAVTDNAILRLGVQVVFSTAAKLIAVLAETTDSIMRGTLFWEHMQQSNLGCKQYYIYSVDDYLTDVKFLDELITYRREKGVEITAIRLESSPHVQHLKYHPEVYNKFVDGILEEARMRALI
ncbi:hypothetical protein, variant [Sphaeroforma arctica JP610]|nr:hypothetical protein, variant [Sphaeroforma arctica JP610]KNC75361.1 hypothetical protein, variant [Sphaeroforma arctica JP610]|eukprot:XP_014149263.1 hypothetical protein, variant [Sphaeroforma arctica JP610]